MTMMRLHRLEGFPLSPQEEAYASPQLERDYDY